VKKTFRKHRREEKKEKAETRRKKRKDNMKEVTNPAAFNSGTGEWSRKPASPTTRNKKI